jgi:hypothetical protein
MKLLLAPPKWPRPTDEQELIPTELTAGLTRVERGLRLGIARMFV